MNPESLKQAREAAEKANDYCSPWSVGLRESFHNKFTPSFTLQLLDHVDALEKKLEKAREALRFYGDYRNWEELGVAAYITINHRDCEESPNSGALRGGKKARETLKEINQVLKGED